VRVVVTGGAGFIGSHLCRELLARGDEVIAIDNLVSGSLRNIEELFGRKEFTFQHHDVSNFVHVPGPVDAVLHFASPASPADFSRIPIPILKVGSLGTHNTLGLAKDKGARFFLASTSEIYGDPLVHPQPETYWGNVNTIGPRGVYDEAKRFAEAMTMAYHRTHGVDVRIVRIFNSVLADEQVVYDDGHELRREPIGDLAARLAGVRGPYAGLRSPDAGLRGPAGLHDLAGYSVPAFDRHGSIAGAEAVALVGHPPTGPCYEVRTDYGRSVRITGDHSLFVEGRPPQPRAVSQLRPGDRIAIAGRIDLPSRDRHAVHLAEVWDAQGRDPWLLDVRAPGLGHLAHQHRDALFAAFLAYGGSGAKDQRRAAQARVRTCIDRHQFPLGALRKLGLAIPPQATVKAHGRRTAAQLPATVPLSNELLWLLGLYTAHGIRYESERDAFVTMTAGAGGGEVLDQVAKVVERDLGLPSARSGSALYVHSRLLLAVFDHLGFTAGPKGIPGWVLGLPLSRLKWFLDGLIGADAAIAVTSDALKDDLLVALARLGVVPAVRRTVLPYPSWQLSLVDRRDGRRTGDIVWATVTAIEEVGPTPLVYDFCVPGRENFYAGTGVMCHNTYGPHMRPDDGRAVSNFLVQAIGGKPLTVYGEGKQTRSFCYVEDEVRGLLALLDSDHVGPVNIGNPNEFTILDLARAVLEVTGSDSEIRFEPLPVDDPSQRRPDITLARRLLGWEPIVDLATGLARTAEWFRRA